MYAMMGVKWPIVHALVGDCCDCDVLFSSSHDSFNSRGSAFLVDGLESKGVDVDQEQFPSIHTRGMSLA